MAGGLPCIIVVGIGRLRVPAPRAHELTGRPTERRHRAARRAGNKDVVDGRINLAKRQQVHAVLASCLAGRRVRYPFGALPGIARLLEATPRLSEDELYSNSLLREPRKPRPPG